VIKIPHVVSATPSAAVSPSRFAAGIRRDSPAGCAVALLGLPDDTGVRLNGGRPGAARGPAAFRAALARYGTREPALAQDLPRVFDAGDVRPSRSLDETHARVTAATAALLDAGLFPVAIGGGHDLTFPFVRAVAERVPRLGGLYFDAHLDVRETPGSGMPFHRLVETCGVTALHLVGFRPLMNSRAHLAWFQDHGGRLLPDAARPAVEGARLLAAKKSAPPLFVSFDLDVLDAAHAPGVSALNPAGLSVREAAEWVRRCGASRRVRCFDLMELNPAFDPDGRTARVAAHLFLTFLEGLSRR
jgi:formiminoglutamase